MAIENSMPNFSAYICLSLSLTIVSCKNKKEFGDKSSNEVIQSSNGLTQTYANNGIKTTVSYQPTSLMISREIDSTNQEPLAVIKAREKYSFNKYFLLSFSNNNREVLDAHSTQYATLLQKLAFSFAPYVSLTTAQGDTVKLATYFLERSYSMQSSTKILLVFSQIPKTERLQINVNEFGLGIGNRSYKFLSKDIDDSN